MIRRLRNSLEEREVLKREPGRPKGANLFPVGALSLVKNVAVLRFFCAVSGWKNQVPTFFKARQEKGSFPSAYVWFPQTKALVRSNEDGKAQKVRIYAAYRVSQLSIKFHAERRVLQHQRPPFSLRIKILRFLKVVPFVCTMAHLTRFFFSTALMTRTAKATIAAPLQRSPLLLSPVPGENSSS